MRAMLLSAGLGTRLRPLTEQLPKPAVPVANRPLGCFSLEHLATTGVKEVVANTHHLPVALRQAYEAHRPKEVKLTFLHEVELLGTGGALHHARAHLLAGSEDLVLVMNGDILYRPNLAVAVEHHRRLGAVATMVLRPDPRVESFGAVELDAEGRVRRLLGAPSHPGPLRKLMFTGVHLLSARAFDDFPASGCVIRAAYRRWIDEGQVVAAVVDESPWRDLGTLQAYLHANLELASGGLAWPGIAPTGAGSLIDPAASVARDATVEHSVIGAHARIDAGVTVSGAVVWPGTHVRTHLRDAIETPQGRVQLQSGA